MIDVHTHLGHRDVLSAHFVDGILESVVRELPSDERTPEARHLLRALADKSLRDDHGDRLLGAMNQVGVTHAVLLIVDFFYAEPQGEERLELIYRTHREILRRHGERFTVFAGVDPRRGASATAWLRRAFDEYGCRGLKLYPPCGFELDDERLWPLYALCREYDAPVLIHTGPSLPDMSIEQRFPRSFAAAATAFPEVTFILGHGLVGEFATHLSLAKAYPNVCLEISGFQTGGFASMSFASRLQRCALELPDKVLYGSDWPLFNFQISPDAWLRHLTNLRERAGIRDDEWNLLLGANAARILKR